ncbi:MAG: sigma factor-like helix-turn-helix DNA-binding protein [bacterium]|nr:sigma factor-like helix-turn-helix DNA-binding protein [bacterium]
METVMKISFKPRHATTQLLNAISNERARDVLSRRYGLSTTRQEPETLEAVGKTYGITRERVRQIESHTLKTIQKSDTYKSLAEHLREIADILDALGGVAAERELLDMLSKNEEERNHILFLLAVGEYYDKEKEGGDFVHHWYRDAAHAGNVREALVRLYSQLDDHIVLPEEEILELYKQELKKLRAQQDNEDVLRRWLTLSKKIDRNPLGEWGRATSPSVRVKGMRGFAYLTLKRHGSPMHFSEVAKQIGELFGKQAHVATTHNELIKDLRFVLVGRGLYALAEWGYSQGVVKDVIRDILEKNGPLSKADIIDRVKRERYVKDNTIAVNLQDSDVFTRLDDGRFALA